MSATLDTARLLLSQGIATIPVRPDKKPLVDWKRFQTSVPTEAELKKFFSVSNQIALSAGRVQCIDFDEKYSRGIYERFKMRAIDVGLDGLLFDLILQQTPSGGYHLVFQTTNEATQIGNLKLANKANNEVMIETRGKGGYFLISPSKGYTLLQGDWTSIPIISDEDRDALLDLARSFDERSPVDIPHHDPSPAEAQPGMTPGDDYDFRADVPALLKAHGWKPAGGSGKYWTRPGKDRGISASWDMVPDRLWVFSSSTQFEPMHCYRPWHIYAVLECGGDFGRAAKELRRQGFGGEIKPIRKEPKPMPADYEAPPEEDEDPPGIEGVDPAGEAPTRETEEDKIRRMLRARQWDPAAEPPPMRITFELGGVVICTPGNLTAITAQAKVGKSALVSALTAAAMSPPESGTDCLTAKGWNEHGRGMLYFDTEQSPDDFWHAVNRAKRRANVEGIPDWLRAYTVADLPAQLARKALMIAMADAFEFHGGLHAVIIDGIADLILDVNNAEECNGIVAELHSLAIRYDCPIITVIHKNPGSEKVRGHLGSQLERKAETNLSLDKEDGVTVVWSAKQRRSPITKQDGPRFAWNDELKMHCTVERVEGPSKKLKEYLCLAESVLQPGDKVRRYQLIERLQNERSTPDAKPSARTVEKWIPAMISLDILCVAEGLYYLNPKHQIC
jgi:hypothetical protein